jgi:hypothetical protein
MLLLSVALAVGRLRRSSARAFSPAIGLRALVFVRKVTYAHVPVFPGRRVSLRKVATSGRESTARRNAMNYDDLPISEDHRKALDARKEFFASRPEIKRPSLPDEVAKVVRDLGKCNDLFAAADASYAFATEAYFAGDNETASFWFSVGTWLTGAAHQCIDNEIHVSPF